MPGKPINPTYIDPATGLPWVHRNSIKTVHIVDGAVTDEKLKEEYVKEREYEEAKELAALQSEYDSLMLNEMYASNRRGFEIR